MGFFWNPSWDSLWDSIGNSFKDCYISTRLYFFHVFLQALLTEFLVKHCQIFSHEFFFLISPKILRFFLGIYLGASPEKPTNYSSKNAIPVDFFHKDPEILLEFLLEVSFRNSFFFRNFPKNYCLKFFKVSSMYYSIYEGNALNSYLSSGILSDFLQNSLNNSYRDYSRIYSLNFPWFFSSSFRYYFRDSFKKSFLKFSMVFQRIPPECFYCFCLIFFSNFCS